MSLFKGGKASRSAEYVVEPGREDEPPIGAEVAATGIRWDVMHMLFQRSLALIWLIKGLAFWAIIIGLGDLPLAEEARLRQTIIIGFAILDCTAAVGLWLLTPWGRSLWLFLVIAEILLGLFGPARASSLVAATGAGLALFAFGIMSFAARKRRLGLF